MQATAVAVPVRDTGDALKASLTGALNTFFAAIPRIIGFAVVLIIGWIISSLLARGVQALLHAVKFNDLARRAGLADFVHKMGVKDDSSAVLAGIVKWFVRLITLVVAFDTLGLPAVSNVLQQLLLWLPNLVVALVVLVIGGLAAKALSQLVRGASAEAGFTNPDMLADGNAGCRLGLCHRRRGQSVGYSHYAHQHSAGRPCGRPGTGLWPCLRAGRTRSCGADPRSGRPQSGAGRAQAGAGSECGSPSGPGHGSRGAGHGAPRAGACFQRCCREWLDRARDRRSSAGGPAGNSGPAQRRHQFVSFTQS